MLDGRTDGHTVSSQQCRYTDAGQKCTTLRGKAAEFDNITAAEIEAATQEIYSVYFYFIYQREETAVYTDIALFQVIVNYLQAVDDTAHLHFLHIGVSSTAAMVSAVRDDRGRPLLQGVRSNFLCATFTESRPICFSFQFLLGYSLMCLRAENLLDSRRLCSKFYLQNSIFPILH